MLTTQPKKFLTPTKMTPNHWNALLHPSNLGFDLLSTNENTRFTLGSIQEIAKKQGIRVSYANIVNAIERCHPDHEVYTATKGGSYLKKRSTVAGSYSRGDSIEADMVKLKNQTVQRLQKIDEEMDLLVAEKKKLQGLLNRLQ